MSWDSMLLLVNDYVSENGGLPPLTTVWKGQRIGMWLAAQYRRYQHGELDAASAEKLRRVPNLFPGAHTIVAPIGRPFAPPTPDGIYRSRPRTNIIPANSPSGFRVPKEVVTLVGPTVPADTPEPSDTTSDESLHEDRRMSHPPGNVESFEVPEPPQTDHSEDSTAVPEPTPDEPETPESETETAIEPETPEVPEAETPETTEEEPDMSINLSPIAEPDTTVKSKVKAVPAKKPSAQKRRTVSAALTEFVAALGTLTSVSDPYGSTPVARAEFHIDVPNWASAAPLLGVWGVKLISSSASGLVFQVSVVSRPDEFPALVEALGTHGRVAGFRTGGDWYVPQGKVKAS